MTLRNIVLALVGALALGPLAQAQTWPEKPVRLLVSFPAATPGDVVARLIQPELQKELGQPVIVENRAGAGGNIGAAEVARAGDHHTFLVGPDTMVTINPHLYRKMGLNPLEDLQPVTHLVSYNQMLVCHPGAQVKTLADLSAKSRAEPLSYASGGPGVPGHMAMELLLAATGMKMSHVPYKGPAPALQDVLGGQVPCGFLAAPAVAPHVRSGKLVALGVSGSRRSPGSPEVPTLAQLGLKDFDASFFAIVAAPRSMPAAVVDRFHKALTNILAQPAIQARLQAADMEVVANTPVQSAQRLRADHQKWERVASRIGLQVD